jgi:hypothetical protein
LDPHSPILQPAVGSNTSQMMNENIVPLGHMLADRLNLRPSSKGQADPQYGPGPSHQSGPGPQYGPGPSPQYGPGPQSGPGPQFGPGPAIPGIRAQLCRSACKWSQGIPTERSIQNAYISLIENAERKFPIFCLD